MAIAGTRKREVQDAGSEAAAEAGSRSSLLEGIGRVEFIAIVALLMALNALAMDILIPAFPDIAETYELAYVTDSQFTILAYLIGFGSSQLIFGPLADRFGRKPPLVIGIGIYVICAGLGVFAPTYPLLLASRVVQGIGAAATRVIAISVVRDTHQGRAMASTMSFVMMVFMIMPIASPVFGQLMMLVAPWHYIFVAMAVVALASLLWTWQRLPETLPESRRRPFHLKGIGRAFRIVLSTHSALYYTLASAGAFSILFAYINIAQPIFGEHYGLGGYFLVPFAAISAVLALTSFVNAHLVHRLGEKLISHGALLVQVIAALAMVAFAWANYMPLWLFSVLLLILMVGFNLMGSNFNSLAMDEVGEVAGSASSVLGFSQTVFGGILGTIVGQLWYGEMLPVAAGFLGVSLLTLAIVLIGEKGRLFGS